MVISVVIAVVSEDNEVLQHLDLRGCGLAMLEPLKTEAIDVSNGEPIQSGLVQTMQVMAIAGVSTTSD